ncbi:polymorphic toxin-type HINT domain-containing protein [Streptomyces sp. NPDC101149]|uniref:polymorphic toxin-type HINT domain-containing protein n=1 Tax=Streptomyces sp. NPDC101149 TaxID=3366113 RepID=UPI00381E10A4
MEAWVIAAALLPGHVLSTPADGHATVVRKSNVDGAADMYNLTVNDLHTYYVLAGNTPVLVHNAGCDQWAAKFAAKNGGEIKTFTGPDGKDWPLGPYKPGGKEVDETWFHHTVVVRDGKVFDQWHPGGIDSEEFKGLWTYGDDIDFGF